MLQGMTSLLRSDDLGPRGQLYYQVSSYLTDHTIFIPRHARYHRLSFRQ